MMQHKAIMAWYQEALGYSMPFRPKELKAASWLLHNGYSLKDIQGCYQHLKEQHFWADKHLSLRKVQDEIGAWKQWTEKQKPQEANHLEEYRQLRGRLPWETVDQETGEIR